MLCLLLVVLPFSVAQNNSNNKTKKKTLTDKSALSLTMPSSAHDGYPAHPAFRASVVHILRHQQLHMEDPIGKSGYQRTLKRQHWTKAHRVWSQWSKQHQRSVTKFTYAELNDDWPLFEWLWFWMRFPPLIHSTDVSKEFLAGKPCQPTTRWNLTIKHLTQIKNKDFRNVKKGKGTRLCATLANGLTYSHCHTFEHFFPLEKPRQHVRKTKLVNVM